MPFKSDRAGLFKVASLSFDLLILNSFKWGIYSARGKQWGVRAFDAMDFGRAPDPRCYLAVLSNPLAAPFAGQGCACLNSTMAVWLRLVLASAVRPRLVRKIARIWDIRIASSLLESQTTKGYMNKRIVLSLLLALSFGLASAVTVRGGPSCAAWINDRDSRDINRFWLLGYLSGLSVALNKDVLKNTDNSALSAWIDNYCRANSLKNLEEAGADLFFELKKQKGL